MAEAEAEAEAPEHRGPDASVPFRQSLEDWRAQADAADTAAFDRAQDHAGRALAALRCDHGAGALFLSRMPQWRTELAHVRAVMEELCAGASDLVLIGAGGASLGAQALARLARRPEPGASGAGGLRFHCLENLDPTATQALLETLDLRTSRFLVVSRSGATAETLAQALAAMAAVGRRDAGRRFVCLTGAGDSALRRLARDAGAQVLDHDPRAGGRFSVLSSVGLAPAAALGLDADAMLSGAEAVLSAAMSDAVPPAAAAPAVGAALAAAMAERGRTIAVLLAYGGGLDGFARWHRQLWAESLGKQGRGTTPCIAMGPADEHSQLQLWLDGPPDKLFTVLSLAEPGPGRALHPPPDVAAREPWLEGCTLDALAAAQCRATMDVLVQHGCPLRHLALAALDERTLGALFMHFMLETILTARLWDVDPFTQPAVDAAKARVGDHVRIITTGR